MPPCRPIFVRQAVPALAVLALIVAVIVGCTQNPATGRMSFTGFMSASDELRVGREEHPKILQQFGGEYSDERVRRYVQQIGERLVPYSEAANVHFTFTVLDSDVVNAFALPGGYVYTTRALLALASSEAELAGVLGHEIGHVAAHHTAERYSTAVLSQAGVSIGATLLGVLTGSSAVSQAAGQLGGNVAQVYLASYSREQESEADMLGVRYIARAGYDDNAMASFLSKLQADSALDAELAGRPGTADEFDIMQTHPRTADRVQAAIEEARKQGLNVANPRVGRDDYLQQIDGLLWSGDRKSGWAVDQLFIHPELRIRFEVPQGFHIINTETGVVALGPDKARVIFNAAPHAPNGTSLADGRSAMDYLRNVWARNVSLSNVETIQVNGFDAATAVTRLQTNSGTMDARLVTIRFDPRTMYRFLFVSPPSLTAALNPSFRQTTYSFRALTNSEAAQAQPPRLRVVTVRPGDTAESLAARMATKDHAAERFRVLNGLQPGQQPKPGDRVKIIAKS